MKKSTIVNIIVDELNKEYTGIYKEEFATSLLEKLIKAGMRPAPIPAKKAYGDNVNWGSMCSMRCNCEGCNPDYPVYKWEKE